MPAKPLRGGYLSESSFFKEDTMVYEYMVYIKNERGRYINQVSILLCLLSAAFFLAQQVKIGRQFSFCIVSFSLITLGLAYNWYTAYKNQQVVYYRRLLVIAGATWFFMPFMQWLGIPLVLLALIEKHSRSPLEIGITDDRVVFNTLIKKEYPWSAFSNIMLKDGLLTVDFKSNRLFQKEIADDTSADQEAEFNDYCHNRLAHMH